MTNTFSRIVLALIPLLIGCLDNVVISPTPTDGGLRDAPPMDVPDSAVCAACGGIASPSCLYAPGCRHPLRICAANTCGDAVALSACGCDGLTFVSGCLTPDRPYQHAGACVVGVGRTDSGVGLTDGGARHDAPALPYCAREVDYNAPQLPDLRFPRAAFALLPGGRNLDAGASIETEGTWEGTRQLAAPLLVGCVATDERPECRTDVVIRVRETGGALQELVVTTPAADLAALSVGTPVVLRARASHWDGAAPVRYEGELTVRRRIDGAVMLAIVTANYPRADIGLPIGLGAAVCRSRPEFICMRMLTAYALRFGDARGARELLPGEQATVVEGGTFRCRNRAAYQRTPSGGAECSDPTPSVASFEVVRQPDA